VLMRQQRGGAMGISTGAMCLEATRWWRDGGVRGAGRLAAELEVAFWEVEPDSGRALDRRRQSATRAGDLRRSAEARISV
jgi:hypothetical protein